MYYQLSQYVYNAQQLYQTVYKSILQKVTLEIPPKMSSIQSDRKFRKCHRHRWPWILHKRNNINTEHINVSVLLWNVGCWYKLSAGYHVTNINTHIPYLIINRAWKLMLFKNFLNIVSSGIILLVVSSGIILLVVSSGIILLVVSAGIILVFFHFFQFIPVLCVAISKNLSYHHHFTTVRCLSLTHMYNWILDYSATHTSLTNSQHQQQRLQCRTLFLEPIKIADSVISLIIELTMQINNSRLWFLSIYME